MKRIMSIICVLSAALPLMAQAPEKMSVDEFFEKYSGTAATESTMLNQVTLKSLAERKGMSRTTAKVLKGLDRIWVINATSDNEEFLEDARLTVRSDKDYQLVSTSSKDGSQASFYLKERSPKSLILLSVSYGTVSFMEIRGEFDILDFGSLSEIGLH